MHHCRKCVSDKVLDEPFFEKMYLKTAEHYIEMASIIGDNY